MVAIGIVAVIAIVLDRISKIAMLSYAFGSQHPQTYTSAADIPVIKDVFYFSYLGNEGMSWGMLEGKKVLLILLCLAILSVIGFIIYITKPEKMLEKISYGMIIGGAIGNLIDRLLYGFVVDFLDFRLINFPTFNVADCFVVVGAILICIYILFFDKKEDEVGKD